MAKRKVAKPAEIEGVLAQILVDANSDDEQLSCFEAAIKNAVKLPVDVRVVGEALSLVAVEYCGNPRRGLSAVCRRLDGEQYSVGFANVRVAPDSIVFRYLSAYHQWLGEPIEGEGLPALTSAKAQSRQTGDGGLDLTQPIDLVVLFVKQNAARCRLMNSEQVITLRTGDLHRLFPAQIVTLNPNKHWRHAGHPYLSGKVVSTRTDIAGLGLTPLATQECGYWSPNDHYWGEEDEPIDEWARPIIAHGPRPMLEMENVVRGPDTEALDVDPIVEAIELRKSGDSLAAQELLGSLLEADLRCLDAHGHLGNMFFDHSPSRALVHYETGTRIGELSLKGSCEHVLAWGLMDNRPFLRCMHGYGLCLWRAERWEQAERVFDNMLWMNPTDNQGVRFILPQVRARNAWVDEG